MFLYNGQIVIEKNQLFW